MFLCTAFSRGLRENPCGEREVVLHPAIENESPRIRFEIIWVKCPSVQNWRRKKFGISTRHICEEVLLPTRIGFYNMSDNRVQYVVGTKASDRASEGPKPKDSESNHI